MYWTPNFGLPQITEALKGGVKHFENLKKFLRFNDNSTMPEQNSPSHGKLYKIRPILNAVLEKRKQLDSEEYNLVDEHITSTKLKSSLKQYLPKKPHKWVYKVFAHCEIKGIIYNFKVYCEKMKNCHLLPI